MGPDGVSSIKEEDIHLLARKGTTSRQITLYDHMYFGVARGEEVELRLRSPDLVYDPTNGLVSSGDIIIGWGEFKGSPSFGKSEQYSSIDWTTSSSLAWSNFLDDTPEEKIWKN